MVARFAGASLALLAFAIVAAAGVLNQNPVTVTLSRAILALFLFFLIGWVLGHAAQLVVAEHERKRETEIRTRYGAAASRTEAPPSGV